MASTTRPSSADASTSSSSVMPRSAIHSAMVRIDVMPKPPSTKRNHRGTGGSPVQEQPWRVARTESLFLALHGSAIRFQLVELVLPGRVHEAGDAGHALGRVVPLAKVTQVAVVVAGDDLAVALVREPFQARRCLAAV